MFVVFKNKLLSSKDNYILLQYRKKLEVTRGHVFWSDFYLKKTKQY